MSDPHALARRTRADRPPPDWEQVYRRNYLERLKRDRPPTEVRAELPALIARGYEDIPEEDLVRLHWYGLAHDKPKIGTFMVRIKVAGGRVSAAQLRGLGRIARERGRDEVELTTRQGVQLHWVPTDGLPDVLAEVEAIGLTTVGAEGDTVRNITSCPVAGLSADELFDVTPVIRAAADFFDGNPAYSNLPRKHKYTIAACPAQCNAPEIADVALVGLLRDGQPGFTVRVGGGMANTPRISRDLGVFVPADRAVDVLRAVTDTWQSDLRYRTSRARARVKFMMDDYGPEGVRAKVEEQLGHALEDAVPANAAGDADHMGVHPQRRRDLVSLGVPVPSGRVSGSVLEAVADLVEGVGGDVRFTRQQNFVIGDVPRDQVDEVLGRLADLDLPVERGRAFARSIACTSQRFCNYSVAETKGKLERILDRLTDRYGAGPLADLAIHLDGCPHACAQHWIGEIGLQGTTTHLPGTDERVEAYDLSVGGRLGDRAAIGRRLLRRVPTTEIDGVLDRLVGAWLEARKAQPVGATYTLGDFCDTMPDEELTALAVGAAVVGEDEVSGVLVRLPGPLQRFAAGADELTVSGSTVAELLDSLAGRHPELVATIAPDGTVAGAYLLAIGDDDIRNRDGLDTPVGVGDVLSVVMAMAGG